VLVRDRHDYVGCDGQNYVGCDGQNYVGCDGQNYVGCDGQNYGKSGGKKLLTSCFSTPLVRINILIIRKSIEFEIYS
jgi:hypothetical protein